jgi:PAS domain S-box-containing protein
MAARAQVLRASGTRGFAASIDKSYWEFLESVPDAMVLSDLEGRIVWVNRNTERMFGYSRDELLGQEIETLVPDRFRTRHRRDRSRYYTDPDIRPMGVGEDLSARGKDGVEFLVEISLSPVEIKGKALVWSAIRNVNDRERSLAQLRVAITNKLIGLRGLVPMCAWCKRIRDEAGSWLQVETYIESHSKARLTHGMCEDCLRQLDPAEHHDEKV